MIRNILDLITDNALMLVMIALVSYLIGSISVAFIVTMYYEKKDIRKFGSGNAGTTNVLRNVGKVAGIITLVGDFSKAVLALVLARATVKNFGVEVYSSAAGQYLSPVAEALYIAGFFCLLGHLFPVYFNFKGGKGVLVAAGMILMVDWRVFIALFFVFAISLIISKRVSVASVVSCLLYPLITYLITFFMYYQEKVISGYQIEQVTIATVMAALIGGIVIFMHRQNIVRIFKGTEPKFKIKGEKLFK